MTKLSQKVLKEIKKKKIEPAPRWKFLLKDYFVWLAFAVSVIIGAIAVCVILYFLSGNDWDIWRHLGISPLRHFVLSLPYLWIASLALFLWLAYFNYKNTKSGYRNETYYIVGLSVIGSLFVGAILHYSLGVGERVDKMLTAKMPVYGRAVANCSKKNVWSRPERGLLGGRVIRIASPDEFFLEDFIGSEWEVQKNEETLMQSGVMIVNGVYLKIIGRKGNGRIFQAKEIRLWMNGRE